MVVHQIVEMGHNDNDQMTINSMGVRQFVGFGRKNGLCDSEEINVEWRLRFYIVRETYTPPRWHYALTGGRNLET